MSSSGKKYGLQLRAPIPAKKPSKPVRPPLGFLNDDDDDVESEIARQASKKKSHKDVEQQHKQALEEDPSVFDYDGVYDEMKNKINRPLEQDRVKREVTKKGDMGDFYRNLLKKNVAFGANTSKRGDGVLPSTQNAESKKESQPSEAHSEQRSDLTNRKSPDLTSRNVPDEPKLCAKHGRSEDMDKDNIEELRLPSTVSASQADSGLQSEKEGITADIGNKAETIGENVKSTGHHHKQSQEALAAAKERYLARKRMREG